MLVRLWLVDCSTAAREGLPEGIGLSRPCLRSLLTCLFLVFLLSRPAFAQSAPTISSISPTAGPVSPVGGSVTIKGSGFGASQNGSSVTFGGVASTPNSWSDTQVVAPVPSSLAPGFVNVVITVGGAASNAQSFLVIPVITGISASSGIIGSAVTLTGTSFGDTQGSSTVTFNGISANASSWSNTSITTMVPVGASNGSVVVTINGWSTNGVGFYVTPNILNLQPRIGPVGTPVTISGNGFGQSQNFLSSVSFNGVAAAIQSWSDTAISATVPQNATTGNVIVTTAANLVSSGVNFTVGSPVTGLSLTPSSSAMLVGETRTLSLVDSSGKVMTGAAWNTDNTAVVTLSMDDPPVLTANNPGIAHITASASGGSAQATITVYNPGSNGGLPDGTISWAVTPAPNFGPYKIMQVFSKDFREPDLFAIESGPSSTNPNSIGNIVRGLTIDGQQMWQTSIDDIDNAVPDALGGFVVVHLYGPALPFIARYDGLLGQQTWKYAPANMTDLDWNLAIRSDGTIFTVENDGTTSRIIGLDGQSGNLVFQYQLPSSNLTDCGVNGSGGGLPGAPMIAPDNSVYFEYFTVTQDITCASFVNASFTLSLVHVTAAGTTSLQTIQTGSYQGIYGQISEYAIPNEVTPDGQGGVLAAWDLINYSNPGVITSSDATYLSHSLGGGISNNTVPLTNWCQGSCVNADSSHSPADNILLGENNTAYATDGTKIVAIDVTSGSVKWISPAPAGDKVQLIATQTGGGVVAKQIDQNGNERVIHLDANGGETDDDWTGAGLEYFVDGTWPGTTGNQVVAHTAEKITTSDPPLWSETAPYWSRRGGPFVATVDGFSQTGANQLLINTTLQDIKAKLSLPKYATCNKWLTGTNEFANAAQFIDFLSQPDPTLNLTSRFGHGGFFDAPGGKSVAFKTDPAFTGTFGVFGVPNGVAQVINDNSLFYQPIAYPDGSFLGVGPQKYLGGTSNAQHSILVHEAAHGIEVGAGTPDAFLHDFGNDKAEKDNDRKVDKFCRNLIEGR